MARPHGEIREVLTQALQEYSSAGATIRQLAEAKQVGYEVARRTVENLVRSGVVESVGREKLAGETHWAAHVYALVHIEDTPQPWGGIEALAEVMKDVTAPAGA
jgi:hypothetical protein